VKREPVQPVPSAPRAPELQAPELRAPEPSRPAGDTAPIPNLLTPLPSAAPAPSGLWQGDVTGLNGSSAPGTGKKAKPKLRPHAAPASTESSTAPAPRTASDITDAKQPATPPKAAAKPLPPAAKQAFPSKAPMQKGSSDFDIDTQAPQQK
jgi:hypothetical protein